MAKHFPNKMEKEKSKEIKSPWNFDQPCYDERSSGFINAGWNHGVGFKQPVGSKGNPKMDVPCLPKKHAQAMSIEANSTKTELYK